MIMYGILAILVLYLDDQKANQEPQVKRKGGSI